MRVTGAAATICRHDLSPARPHVRGAPRRVARRLRRRAAAPGLRAAHRRRREGVRRGGERGAEAAPDPRRHGRLDPGDVHHGRHGAERRRHEGGPHGVPLADRPRGRPLRRGGGRSGHGADAPPPEARLDAARAARRGEAARARRDLDADRGPVRQGTVVRPAAREGGPAGLPRHPRDGGDLPEEPGRGCAPRGVARLALHLAGDEAAVRAARRARQRGRARDRLRRPRRAVALEVRHGARRVRGGRRPALGRGEAALRGAALLRARPAPARSTARSRSRTASPSRRTCSATSGRRSGRTSTRSWRRTRASAPPTSPRR